MKESELRLIDWPERTAALKQKTQKPDPGFPIFFLRREAVVKCTICLRSKRTADTHYDKLGRMTSMRTMS